MNSAIMDISDIDPTPASIPVVKRIRLLLSLWQ